MWLHLIICFDPFLEVGNDEILYVFTFLAVIALIYWLLISFNF